MKAKQSFQKPLKKKVREIKRQLNNFHQSKDKKKNKVEYRNIVDIAIFYQKIIDKTRLTNTSFALIIPTEGKTNQKRYLQ